MVGVISAFLRSPPSPLPPPRPHCPAVLMTTPTFQQVITLLDVEVERKSYLFADGDGVSCIHSEVEVAVDKEVTEFGIWCT